jgi:predicted ATPase/DNA-binding SARP family transcriptional activator
MHLFGSPRIVCDGESFVLPFERRSQLLVLLALKRSWVSRLEIAAMLWPEQPDKLAHANLRKTLFRLQSVPWARRIEIQGNAVRLESGTDVFDFESALREQRIADALSLRRGELLVGFDDDGNEAWSNWLSFERERTRAAWRGAALERLGGGIEPAEGIELSARLLDADALDEAALRAHMLWLANSGQSAGARHAYQAFAERLALDLGLDPGTELRALHESLGASPAHRESAPRAASPAPDDGFVGRTTELRRIAELLAQDDCRLLCLIGPGGAGKTRLAQRLIQQQALLGSGGAAFVALEDAVVASELGARIAREIGVDLRGTAEPLDQVIEFLRERHMLIVLDNFEQLAPAALILERLLRSCARLKIVVTSRVRLAVRAEWLFPVEGLPCPEMEDQDHIDAFDAVRLFVRAARRVAPALDPVAEAGAIGDICRQVEGLPLALELAAAWTRVLSCDAIAADLRHGTELLRAVDATHAPRHASIEFVFDQSWRLLTAIERDVLARLSVFRGGFSVEAARAVAGASLPVLGALADKSLLRKDDARIFLHPLVLQMSALRLGEGQVRASTEAAHARYFHRLLAQRRRGFETGDREALQQVASEFENCRIAWHWSVAHEALDLLATSAPSLLRYCDERGQFEEGLVLLTAALESTRAAAAPKLRAQLLRAVAHLEFRLDRYSAAEATAEQGLAQARTARDLATKARCLNVLGSCCLMQDRHRDARRFFKQALRQAQASSDHRNAAAMMDNLALVEGALGHSVEAVRLSTESLALYQRLGDVADEALCLNNLGSLHMDSREFVLAGIHLRAGLVLCDRHGLVSTRGLILTNLTECAIKSDDCDAARSYARQALDFAQAGGHRSLVAQVKLYCVLLDLRRSDQVAARSDLEAAMRIAIEINRPSQQLVGVSCFAQILAAQGEWACARLVMAFAADHPLMSAPGRDDARLRLAKWRTEAGPEPAWTGPELGELTQRIVAETALAHAPLITLLRAAQ